MSVKYQSATFVAEYLGVSTGSVHNWSKNPPEGFPEPDSIHYGLDGKVTARGWLPERLPAMREWQAARLGKKAEEAAAEWLLIDAEMSKGNRRKVTQVPPGQIALDIPTGYGKPVTVERVACPADLAEKTDDILIGTYNDDRIGDAAFKALGILYAHVDGPQEEFTVGFEALECLVSAGYAAVQYSQDDSRAVVVLGEPVLPGSTEGE
jgi:hypothetical protein